MQNPIIAALDVPTAEQALKLAQEIAPAVGAFKIGKELFTSAGPDIVKRVRDTGASVFLDLKFHDIPNTVAKAIAAAVRLDVQMVTIHTSGGSEIMRAAEQAAQQTALQAGRNAPLVLGVTVLTSHDANTLATVRPPPSPVMKSIRPRRDLQSHANHLPGGRTCALLRSPLSTGAFPYWPP